MPADPRVWFAIPSANPDNCRRVLPQWRAMGYQIAVLQNRVRAEIPADRVVWSDHYPGWPESINILCRDVVPRDADIVVSGGDDMLPDPHVRAEVIARQFVEHFRGTLGVMQPHGDAFLNTHLICGSPWLGREWIDRAYSGRGPMPGCYHHNWADVELYIVSKGLNLLWSRSDLTQYHDHFMRDAGAARPAYWRAAAAGTDLADCQLFLQRAILNFPDHQPLGASMPFDRSAASDEVLAGARQRLTNLLERAQRLVAILRRCAQAGMRRVVIAGYAGEAVALAPVLAKSPVSIAGWIDPISPRESVLGYPLLDAPRALLSGVQGAVVMSEGDDVELWDALAPLRERGVPLLRIGLPGLQEKRDRFVSAAKRLAQQGRQRLAVYGAGAHTRELGDLLAPAGVVAVIDDNPALTGQSVVQVPIIPSADAPRLGVQGVILSSDAHEDRLWLASRPLAAAGIALAGLYTLPPEP